MTKVGGKVYSFPLCIEGRGIIYNKAVLEETLGKEFDPESITTLDDFKGILEELKEAGMERPISVAKEDWSLGAHQLQYIYETEDGTSPGAQAAIESIKNGTLDLKNYERLGQFLDMFDVLREYNLSLIHISYGVTQLKFTVKVV